LDAGSDTPAVHRVLSPVSSTMSSAFPKQRWVGFPRMSHELRLLVRSDSRGCRYSFMFRPRSLLAASKFARPPDRSYRREYCRRAAGAFTACSCGGNRRNWPGNPGFRCRPLSVLKRSPECSARTRTRSPPFERRLRIRESSSLTGMRRASGCVEAASPLPPLPSASARQSQRATPRQPPQKEGARGVHKRRRSVYRERTPRLSAATLRLPAGNSQVQRRFSG
jgi:hypothetical protein